MHDGVIITWLDEFCCVEVIGEQYTDAFTPRITAHRVYDAVAVSTRLFILTPAFTRLKT